jgi:hypothetical protein
LLVLIYSGKQAVSGQTKPSDATKKSSSSPHRLSSGKEWAPMRRPSGTAFYRAERERGR